MGGDLVHKKECVLFDVDGTLIDTEEATIEALRLTMKNLYNIEYSKEELYFAMGIPGKCALEKLNIKNIDYTLKVWGELIQKFSYKTKLYPQIEELLDILKSKGIKLGIVTSRYDFEVEMDMVLRKIIHYFDVVVTYDESLKPKPYPDQILKAIKEFNINSNDAVYIGDTIYDYGCAKNGDVDFILANWGEIDRKSNFEYGNFNICNKPFEILNYVIGG
ncbi:HAD family hydrolase [Caloramator sp. E03]|nr:HAD family hydrolase [Caloramator sp. E03]